MNKKRKLKGDCNHKLSCDVMYSCGEGLNAKDFFVSMRTGSLFFSTFSFLPSLKIIERRMQ